MGDGLDAGKSGEPVAHTRRIEGDGLVAQVRDIVFRREDGTETLVTIWSDGHATLADRAGPGATWGPPVESRIDTGGVVQLRAEDLRLNGPAAGVTGPACSWCESRTRHVHTVNTTAYGWETVEA